MLSLKLLRIRSEREHFENVYRPDLVVDEPDGFRVVDPVLLSFDVQKDKEQFQLTGTVQTAIELSCGRCLEAFRLPVDAPFDLRYQRQAVPTGGDEREIDQADLSAASYEGDEIDLRQFIRER